MFPFENDEVEELETTDEAESIPREWGINFDTGQLSGEKVDGIEALKVWAWLALKSARYRFSIYSWNYGSELEDLFGTQYSQQYTASLIQHMIQECLMVNTHIKGIKDFVCSFTDDVLTAKFTMETDCGEVEVNV